MPLDDVLADLTAESFELDMIVGGLPTDRWATPTPAEGWTVAHQIAHLAWTDEAARMAAEEPDEFKVELQKAVENPSGFVDQGAAQTAALPPVELLAYWRETRAELVTALRAVRLGRRWRGSGRR